jgi:hypothetical protein
VAKPRGKGLAKPIEKGLAKLGKLKTKPKEDNREYIRNSKRGAGPAGARAVASRKGLPVGANMKPDPLDQLAGNARNRDLLVQHFYEKK